MIDSLCIQLDKKELNPKNRDMIVIKNSLNVDWDYGFKISKWTGKKYYCGRLKNFVVYLEDSTLRMIGSLCKFYLGNSLETLTRRDLKPAFASLAKELNHPLRKAKITNLDFAANAIVDHPPSLYLSRIEFLERSKVLAYEGNSKTYLRNKKKTMFYDKIKELREKRQPVPRSYRFMNVIRFETRFVPKRVFKYDLLVEDLFEEAGYKAVLKYWVKELLSVPMKSSYHSLLPYPETYQEFKEQLVYQGIKKIGGLHMALEKMAEMRKLGKTGTSGMYWYSRRDLKQLCKRIDQQISKTDFGLKIMRQLKRKLIQAAFAPELPQTTLKCPN